MVFSVENKKSQVYSILSDLDHKTLFEHNPSPMWVYDLDTLRFLAVNESAVYTYGYSKEEFLSMSLVDIRPSEYIPILKANILINEQEIQKSTYWRHKKKDGSTIYVDILSHSLPSLEKIRTRLVMALDVTESKLAKDNLKEREKEYRNLFENALVGIYKSTPSGKILKANPSFINMLGYSSLEELTNIDLNDIFQSDSPRTNFINLINKVGEVRNLESKLLRKNGSVIHILENAVAIKNDNGDVIFYEGTIQDITKQKMLQVELLKAKEKAEESDKLKSIFLSNMSHELITPLIGLIGGAELLSEQFKNSSDYELFNAIISSGRRLSETFNSILNLSLIEANKFNLSFIPISVNEIINEVIEINKTLALSKNLYLNFHQDYSNKYVNGEKYLLFTIFNSIVNNAVKYTSLGGVTVKTELSDSLNLKISVIDTGLGISPENHKIIFESFRQISEGMTRKFEGSGIGLTITKKFVELLGGTIHLESEPGKGSTFSVIFPVYKQ